VPATAHILFAHAQPPQVAPVIRRLRQRGHWVDRVGTGREVMERASGAPPDVVVLSVRLPDVDGFELCRRLKSEVGGKAPLVVLESPRATAAADVARGSEIGIDAHVRRPMGVEEYVARLEMHWKQKQVQDRQHMRERFFQEQFDHHMRPIWIVDARENRVLAANRTVARLYEVSVESLVGRPFVDWFVDGQHDPYWAEVQGSPVRATGRSRHRRGTGDCLTVDWEAVELEWGGHAARAVVVTDITDRQALAAEQARHQSQFEIEMGSLAVLSGAVKTGRFHAPLPEADPGEYLAICQEYDTLLDRALEQRVYRAEGDVPVRLRRLADQLGERAAGPREITELHYQVMRVRSEKEPALRVRALMEAGRLNLLELMGNLASYYRARLPQAPWPASEASERLLESTPLSS
jgi:DNA-binding response OmpR family regulator